MRCLALVLLVACSRDDVDKPDDGADAPDVDTSDADTDADSDADSDTDTDTDTVTPSTTGDTATGTPDGWTDWNCQGGGCTWDCTTTGLRLETPGVFDVELTADCTVAIEAWGGGGGGGGNANGPERGGGGGGGGTLVFDDAEIQWVIAGGGGGGGAGDGPDGAGGGGGGGHGVDVISYASGTHLTLIVGGGGDKGCNNMSGDGGAPGGGLGSNCSGADSNFGGGGGRVAGCGSPGNSTYGGGGGGNGGTLWGGAGGGDSGSGCSGLSTHGGNAGCGPGSSGGGGGGGGARGTTAEIGVTGDHGNAGMAGGASPGGGAGGAGMNPVGVAPGGGGSGSMGCGGGAGGDGALYLAVDAGPGAVCPADEVEDCAGACGPARWLGDGVCDAGFDCVGLNGDMGDCPAVGVQIPSFLQGACPAETAETAFCFTALGYDVGLVGLDSGSFCPVTVNGGYSYDFDNLAFPAPYRFAYVCDYGTLAEYDLELGGVRYSNTGCDGVTEHMNGLLVKGSIFGGYDWYATFEDVLNGNAVAAQIAVGNDLKFTSDGATFYGSWFIADRLSRSDFAGNMLQDMPLQDFYDTINGLEVHQGVLHVVSGNDIQLFDPLNGDSLGLLPIAGIRGLGCVSP